MALSDLKVLTNARKYVRGQVTAHHNRRSDYPGLEERDKLALVLKIKNYKSKLDEYNVQYQNLKFESNPGDSELDQEFSGCNEYDCKIAECLGILECKNVPKASNLDDARSLLRSPIAPLPVYKSKDEEDIHKFFSQFEDTISKFKYSAGDKFLLLKQQVTGKGSLLLDSLEATKRSYDEAKKLLLKAFASPSASIFNVIKQISEMKLNYSDEPFAYISQIRSLCESVETLSITEEHFLQYFFWNGMHDKFKFHLVQITNKSKPSLKDIHENFFEACERHTASTKGSKEPKNAKEVSSFASRVEVEKEKTISHFKGCILCSKSVTQPSNHPISKCSMYPSPQEKLAKLKSLGACTKCTDSNHTSSRCNFNFKRNCFHCNELHCSFVCPNYDNFSKNKVKGKGTSKSKPNETVSTGTLTFVESHNIVESGVILPTFSCGLKNDKIHAFKDSGCQPCFIKQSLAVKHGLRVIRSNIEIRVGGFNSNKRYFCNVVEVPLTIGDCEYIVEAYTLPYIRVRLSLPGLSAIAKAFMEKGYTLADEFILNCNDVIEDLDFTLGSKSSHCLLTSDVAYGPDFNSVYSDSPIGTLLLGDIAQINRDLPYLPCKIDRSSPGAQCVDSEASPCIGAFDSSISCPYGTDTSDKFFLLDPCNLDDSDLIRATNEILSQGIPCGFHEPSSSSPHSGNVSEMDKALVKFALDTLSRTEDGRLIMPLFWSDKLSHLLGRNKNLAEAILKSNLRKLKLNKTYLDLMDSAFKEQESMGIIEKIDDLDKYLQDHPSYSFLAHMGVFRLQRDTTKCRVVFLSNLCGKDSDKAVTLSHNQVMHAGPNMNQKLSSSLCHLRFGSMLLVFDIQKAFSMIQLSEEDQSRLLFLWFRNVSKNDFTLVGYKNSRLPFGLRCSPCILLIALYHILIVDTNNDSNELKKLKELIYQLMYMDNGAIVAESSEKLKRSFQLLENIFGPYKFQLQQYVTNDKSLQECIDGDLGKVTPDRVKLLGLCWDTMNDTLSTEKIELDTNANTKRKVLSTIASQYDIFNINGPILNRSRLFSHKLQCDPSIDWDTVLSPDLRKEWHNISTQVNSSPSLCIPRFCGTREDSYKLVAFTDASKSMYGAVVYVESLVSGKRTFLMSRNRMVSKSLQDKSIPSLEIHAIALGAEVLMDTYDDLAGDTCVQPLVISQLWLYTDSLVCLHWLNEASSKFTKMQKKSVFVKNRINHITRLCETHEISFAFVSGIENPADCTTRCMSFKQLGKSTYFSGPDLCNSDECSDNLLVVTIPNPSIPVSEHKDLSVNSSVNVVSQSSLFVLEHYSSLARLVSVVGTVLKFVNILKSKVGRNISHNLNDQALKVCIRQEQSKCFSDVVEYFDNPTGKIHDIPPMVTQFNIYKDKEGVLRVKGKMFRNSCAKFPILLPKNGWLTNLIVEDYHTKFNHAGCYQILSELRKVFFIPHIFTVVKRCLKKCLWCKRFKARTVKLNQNSYRHFRMNPPQIPFAYLYMDYIGPFTVVQNGSKVKKWLLCLTCMWSRAVNLKICDTLNVQDFLRSFQLHVFDYGVPQYCVSDLGSQITSGVKKIANYLNNAETHAYFSENNIKPLKFDHFPKGRSQLGGLVEVCVKGVKRLIYGAVGRNILSDKDFEFTVCEAVHIINRRPIAFEEHLRSSGGEDFPDPITPETLIRGFSLVSLNLVPELQPEPVLDPSWGLPSHIRDVYVKLKRVRANLSKLYHNEFLSTLLDQSVDKKGSYRPVAHHHLRKGDIVLLKEDFTKPLNYPMALILDVTVNDIGETTGALLRKGGSRDIIKRHSSRIIPLLSSGDEFGNDFDDSGQTVVPSGSGRVALPRAASPSRL